MESQTQPAATCGNRARNWLATGFAILSFGLLAVLVLPSVTAAESAQNDPDATGDLHTAALQQIDCATQATEGDFPRMTEFLGELVADGVISQEQADEIDRRFRELAEYTCLLHQLFPKREAFGVTADITGTHRHEVVRAMIGGGTLAEYAADHGIDEATLIAALMEAPADRAADMVAAGDLSQEEADELLAEVETYIGELIHAEGLRGFFQTRW
jgi:polyhydroxyalkanoate synthesis regulator phasin